MSHKNDNNDKQLAYLKEMFGIENPSPDQLREALKELTNRKVISKFNIKKEKE